MFEALDQTELTIVIDAMEEVTFQKDEVIIRQGEDGDNLYVVEAGEMVCSRVSVRNNTIEIIFRVPTLNQRF